MKRSATIWIIIIILLLLGVTVYILSRKDKVPTVQDEINNCLNPYNTSCITNLAIKYKNESICDNIGSVLMGVGCLEEVYISIGDINNCGRLEWGEQDCRNAILNKTN